MSGGQQQRVAVARALFSSPKLLLVDEPTGNLNKTSAREVMTMIRNAVGVQAGNCGVLVTHDEHSAAFADRVVILDHGRVSDEVRLGPWDQEKGVTGRAQRIMECLASSSV